MLSVEKQWLPRYWYQNIIKSELLNNALSPKWLLSIIMNPPNSHLFYFVYWTYIQLCRLSPSGWWVRLASCEPWVLPFATYAILGQSLNLSTPSSSFCNIGDDVNIEITRSIWKWNSKAYECSVYFPWNEATKIIANIYWAFSVISYYSYLHT